jgi:hypothetical protein
MAARTHDTHQYTSFLLDHARTTHGEHVVFNEHVGYGGEDTHEATDEHTGSDG